MIREIHQLHGDNAFRSYDEQFRKLKESLNVPWQNTIQELRLKAATNTRTFSPKVTQNLVQPFRSRFCFQYNRGNAVLEIPVPFDMPACSIGETTQNQNALNHLNTSFQVHKQNLPTPIKVKNLLAVLQGYEKEKLRVLLEGFSYGFHLGCTDLPSSKVSRNHKSAIEYPSVIQDFIAQGRELGRIAGPFPSPPLLILFPRHWVLFQNQNQVSFVSFMICLFQRVIQ